MAENEAVETAATEVTEAVETTGQEQEPSAETQNTAPAIDPVAEEGKVPYARFKGIVEQRNQEQAENQRLKARLAELEPDPGAEETGGDDSREQARKMIEADAGAYFERELGMSMAEARTRLTSTDNLSQDHVERKWEAQCKEHGLDPASADLQSFVGGAVKYQSIDVDEALKRAKTIFAATTKSVPTADVEDGGVIGAMTKSDQVFWDAKSAAAAAKKGISSPHVSTMDIINKRRKESS